MDQIADRLMISIESSSASAVSSESASSALASQSPPTPPETEPNALSRTAAPAQSSTERLHLLLGAWSRIAAFLGLYISDADEPGHGARALVHTVLSGVLPFALGTYNLSRAVSNGPSRTASIITNCSFFIAGIAYLLIAHLLRSGGAHRAFGILLEDAQFGALTERARLRLSAHIRSRYLPFMGVLWLAMTLVLITFAIFVDTPAVTKAIVSCVFAPYAFAGVVCAFSVVPIVAFAHADATDCAVEFYQLIEPTEASPSLHEEIVDGRVKFSLDLIARNRKHLYNCSLAMTPSLVLLIAGFFAETVLLIAAIVELVRAVGSDSISVFLLWCCFFVMFLVFFLGCSAYMTRAHQNCLFELRRNLVESDELSAHVWRLQLLLATTDDDTLRVAGISVTPALTVSVASVMISLVGFLGASGALSK